MIYSYCKEKINRKLKEKLQDLPEIDKDNIYFDGMRKILTFNIF